MQKELMGAGTPVHTKSAVTAVYPNARRRNETRRAAERQTPQLTSSILIHPPGCHRQHASPAHLFIQTRPYADSVVQPETTRASTSRSHSLRQVEMKTEGAVADSGAQLCIYPADRLRAARVSLCNMKQTKVDHRSMPRSTHWPCQENAFDAQAKCTSSRTSTKFISLDDLRGLHIVGKNFPKAGTSPNQHECNQCVIAAATASHDCGCPEQKPPPGPPTHLPFALSVANVQEMKAWLLDRYGASTFNKCPYSPCHRWTGPRWKYT